MPANNYEKIVQSLQVNDESMDLYFLFARARYLAFRAREKELQRYDITPEQAQALLVIDRVLDNKGTPAQISRNLVREPHTITAILNRMESKGLIIKVKDLERKNMIRVALTEEGKKALEISTRGGPIHRIMGVLNENERQDFQRFLERIALKARQELGLDRDTLPLSD